MADQQRADEGGTGSSRTRGLLGDVLVCLAIAIVTIAGTAALWVKGGGAWFDDSYIRIVGWVGALVSLVGVLLAYLIFRRQKRDADSASARQIDILSGLQEVMGQVHAKVTDLAMHRANEAISDSEAEEGAGLEDLWADVAPERSAGELYLTSPSGKRRRVFEPRDIPMAVVGALVGEWRRQGLSGKWPLGALRGAFRAEGKGNHPWYLILVPPHDEDNPRMWKVTRGPGDADRAVQVTNPKQIR
ncbi:hypothetical protein [Cellulomonas triticagri]|nr:hypothetical protein [Cellulomonas triticagri]